jgi:predicted HNH restriction endonuclease
MSGLRIGNHLITKESVLDLLLNRASELEIIYTDHLAAEIAELILSTKNVRCTKNQKKHLEIFIFEQCSFLLSGKDFQETGKRRYIWKDKQIKTTTQISQLPLPFGQQTLFDNEIQEDFLEGKSYLSSSTEYERDSKAREHCLRIYGYDCTICGFNFEKTFGNVGRNYIHVHHLIPLHIGERKTNSEKDLRPVCPNCHAMLHRRNPPFSIEELKQKRQTNK